MTENLKLLSEQLMGLISTLKEVNNTDPKTDHVISLCDRLLSVLFSDSNNNGNENEELFNVTQNLRQCLNSLSSVIENMDIPISDIELFHSTTIEKWIEFLKELVEQTQICMAKLHFGDDSIDISSTEKDDVIKCSVNLRDGSFFGTIPGTLSSGSNNVENKTNPEVANIKDDCVVCLNAFKVALKHASLDGLSDASEICLEISNRTTWLCRIVDSATILDQGNIQYRDCETATSDLHKSLRKFAGCYLKHIDNANVDKNVGKPEEGELKGFYSLIRSVSKATQKPSQTLSTSSIRRTHVLASEMVKSKSITYSKIHKLIFLIDSVVADDISLNKNSNNIEDEHSDIQEKDEAAPKSSRLSEAVQVLRRVEAKLLKAENSSYVDILIHEATDVNHLSRMYEGWMPWI
eukprot:CAMPEP_0204825524 /NCGR_PEP_ID=MMETSP1346-20131115/3397_1 /ASSEMBLY_ACC=CAM_ASM_000771 /TAXON_ID=215587 /ORGANISM="Aplanochytrium stocchinoi, Strain GSBS06" /LENGTH=406 /DNA_ID=CAMNT_0051953181 /DNA_START=15 /DNA_END=1238 /DNA_ORIENTATION=+